MVDQAIETLACYEDLALSNIVTYNAISPSPKN